MPTGTAPSSLRPTGDAIFSSEITSRACIACHDDWDPAKPYAANGLVMPANLGDETCTACHGENPTEPNSAIDIRKAHTHPLLDVNDPPLWGPTAGAVDLAFDIKEIKDVGGDDDGIIEVGEKVEVSLDIIDADGNAVAGSRVARMEVAVTGPMENPNLLYVTTFSGFGKPPTSVLGDGPSHTFVLPERIEYEIASGSGTSYSTSRAPHYPTKFGSGYATSVYTVPPTVLAFGSGLTTSDLAEDMAAYQNYADLESSSGFSAGDVVVIDDGMSEVEYAKVANVQGDRLWFAAPIDVARIRVEKSHPAGAAVSVVSPVLVDPSGYTLNDVTGTSSSTRRPRIASWSTTPRTSSSRSIIAGPSTTAPPRIRPPPRSTSESASGPASPSSPGPIRSACTGRSSSRSRSWPGPRPRRPSTPKAPREKP